MNRLFLLQHIFNRAMVMLGVAGLPLTIPSNRNNFCLLHEALSWARIIFGITDALLNISSTRNYLYIFYGAFNMAMITLGVVGFSLTVSSSRNLFFPSMECLTGSGSYWTMLTSLWLLLLHGHFSFLHPAGSSSFPNHPLSLILALETHPSSLSLEQGQKPWHCIFLLCPAGRLSPSSRPSSLVYFHFVKSFSNNICRPLWSCHLWRKKCHL